MSSYSISPKLKSNRVFILQKSELEKRFDPQFYINRVNIKNSVKLSTLVKVKGGKRIPKGKYYSETSTDYQYLRVSDMQDFGLINWGGLRFIPADVYYFLERYKVSKGDVIISIAGTVGKTALIEKEIKNTILTENCAILEIRDKLKLLPKYLHILLELSTSKRQIELGFIQTTIPKLGFDKIEQLQLPSIPSIEKQFEIIELYDKSIAKKQKNEAEAENLLSSIDDYLLKELGITLPKPPENTLKNRMFTTKISELSGNRHDPNYHQKYFLEVFVAFENGKYEYSQIRKYASFQAGYAFKSSDYLEQSKCLLITIKNIRQNQIDIIDATYLPDEFYKLYPEFQIKNNDLLIAMTGATIGKVGIYNHPNNSLLNQRNGIIKPDNINSTYLMSLLNLPIFQKLILRNSNGGAQPNISETDIMRISIPVPPLDKQKEIANHITDIRQQAQQLKDKTKELLKTASAEIEKILLT